MAQNLYSLTRFSLGSESSAIQLTMNCAATFKGSFGIGANAVLQDASMQMAFDSKTQGSIGLPLLMDLTADLDSQALGGTAIVLFFKGSADFSAKAVAGAVIPMRMDLVEDLAGRMVLGADLPLRADVLAALDANASLGADFVLGGSFAAILSSSASVVDITEEISLIAVDLAPGDELRIDSENFTVTLNGVNILHLQEGDWIRLGRGLLAIGVDSGTAGALSGSLICEERWL